MCDEINDSLRLIGNAKTGEHVDLYGFYIDVMLNIHVI